MVGVFLAFLVVYREAFETILFYAALWTSGNGNTILAGALSAVVLLAVIAWVMLRLSKTLPIGQFFRYSAILIAILAVILIGKGVGALQEAGTFSVTPVAGVPRITALGLFPTFESLGAQLAMIAALVVGVILWKVIPTFAAMFEGLGAELPLPTRVVIRASDLVVAWGWLALILLGLAGYAVKRYYGTPAGRHAIDALLLKSPVLGNILRRVAVARFCRTLSTLLASGVPILDGMDITARTSGNAIIEDAILLTRTKIERGETVAAPLRETNVFPSMVVQMINVGETTGALDAMLSKIADFYEEEVDTAVAGLLTLLEPIMIAFLGVIVGGIVIAMYMPIFDLISKLA